MTREGNIISLERQKKMAHFPIGKAIIILRENICLFFVEMLRDASEASVFFFVEMLRKTSVEASCTGNFCIVIDRLVCISGGFFVVDDSFHQSTKVRPFLIDRVFPRPLDPRT